MILARVVRARVAASRKLRGVPGGFGSLHCVIGGADFLYECACTHRADSHLLAQRLGGDRPVMLKAMCLVDPPRIGQQFVEPRPD
jgi:hypothetical protein